MAFEELTQRHAAVWSSAPFENVAELITDMHARLVERLAPNEGERGSTSVAGQVTSPSTRPAPERR